jgi:hypothetical protein
MINLRGSILKLIDLRIVLGVTSARSDLDVLIQLLHDREQDHHNWLKRGRPGGQGKQGNPDYAQVTAYIPKTLHDETKVNLIRQGNKEFSQLVEELLTGWNLKQGN